MSRTGTTVPTCRSLNISAPSGWSRIGAPPPWRVLCWSPHLRPWTAARLIAPDAPPPILNPMDASTAAPARPQRGDELELRIDSLAYGGAGGARAPGAPAVFPAPEAPATGGGRGTQQQRPPPR